MPQAATHAQSHFVELPDIMVSIRPSHLTIYEQPPRRGARSEAQQLSAENLHNADAVAARNVAALIRDKWTNPADIVKAIKAAVTYSGLLTCYFQYTGRSLQSDLLKDGRIHASFIDEMADKIEQDISEKAGRRIKKAVTWLVNMAEPKPLIWTDKKTGQLKRGAFKVNFVTLTLPASQSIPAEYYNSQPESARQWFTYSEIATRKTWISDNDIKAKLLNQFLTECKQHVLKESAGAEKMLYYFWRAEAQKNGNIHFHLLADRYLHHEYLKTTWNRILNKMGFIDRYQAQQKEKYKNGFAPDLRKANQKENPWTVSAQIEAYKKGVAADWTQPNSTDVHSVNKIQSLGAYLSKYVSKAEENRKISGRKWYISTALSKLNSATAFIEDVADEIKNLQKKCKTVALDHCTQIYAGVSDWIKLGADKILANYRRYKEQKRAEAMNIPPPLMLIT